MAALEAQDDGEAQRARRTAYRESIEAHPAGCALDLDRP